MKRDFWEKLNKPITAIAPMEDVTDVAFRQIIAKYGKPDILWTEFISADGLDSIGKEKLIHKLAFEKNEHPIIAQFFSTDPNKMRKAAKLAFNLGFDGVDINMGCPERNICKQGAGAGVIKTPKLAQEIIKATQEIGLPVSVKTRIGFNRNEIETWLPILLETNPVAITLHARTRKEMSKVPANWDVIKRAVEIRNEFGSQTLILGNGDIKNKEDALNKVEGSGCDGYMVGRAILGNPWFFSNKKPNREEKLKVMMEHAKLYEKLLGDRQNFSIMKKHFKAYASGFNGAKDLRVKLMKTENVGEVEEVVKNVLGTNS